jgi:predicted acetyltransferase
LLTPTQANALDHVRRGATRRGPELRARIEELLERWGAEGSYGRIEHAFRQARVTASFHPDRLCQGGRTVVEGMIRDGLYRSQFETGITSGSPTAYPGGERDIWENTFFGGAYREAMPEERPKYGALDLMGHADGGSPRFGSCHLVFHEAIAERCTFSWGDSHQGPEHTATLDALEPVVWALLDTLARTSEALGERDLHVRDVARRLERGRACASLGRALDDYLEAQIHGEIRFDRDVSELVVDPSFAGTETFDALSQLSRRYGVKLREHPGYGLGVLDVPEHFRGPRMIPLGRRVAEFSTVEGKLDAATLGRAAASLSRTPEHWIEWGPPAETWQLLKQLWHVLVRYGQPLKHVRPDLRLVRPSERYRETVLRGLGEFRVEGLPWWTGGDFGSIEQDFGAFVKKKREDSRRRSDGFVPALHLWAIVNGRFAGRISIRRELTPALRLEGGHIGFDTVPTYRGHGIATEMLRKSLPIARKLGLREVLITCNDTNRASIRVIEANGGVLVTTKTLGPNRPPKRHYRITLG